MHPEVRTTLLPAPEEDMLESYEEHHVADVLCTELAGLAPGAERFDAKTTVLIENVTITSKRTSGSRRCGPASAVSSCRKSEPGSRKPGPRHPGRRLSPAR